MLSSHGKNKARSVTVIAVIAVVVLCVTVYMIKSNPNNRNAGGIPEGEATVSTLDQTSATGVTEQNSLQDDETTAEKTSKTEASTTAIEKTTAEKTTVAETTTKEKTTTAKDATAAKGEYEYAYAGFNPSVADTSVPWNLLLVNRDYILPEDFTVKKATAVDGYVTELDYRVAGPYTEMYNAAKKEGMTLVPLSGFRRVSTQHKNFEKKIEKYRSQGYSKAEATQIAATIVLPPGTSEHNAGLAMDICSLETSFEKTKEFRWLQEHAADYGFILRYPKEKQDITKITYEPWHWRYVGKETAKAIKASGKCLEEYLGYA